MTRSRWFLSVLAVALPLAAGCSARQPSDVAHSNPTHLNPAQAKNVVQEASTGHRVDASGAIPADQAGKKFSPGEPVFVAFKTFKAPVGAQVRVDWYGPDDVKIGSQAKQVARPETAMNFAATDTAAWNPGTYRVEIWVADQKADTEVFAETRADASTDNG